MQINNSVEDSNKCATADSLPRKDVKDLVKMFESKVKKADNPRASKLSSSTSCPKSQADRQNKLAGNVFVQNDLNR